MKRSAEWVAEADVSPKAIHWHYKCDRCGYQSTSIDPTLEICTALFGPDGRPALLGDGEACGGSFTEESPWAYDWEVLPWVAEVERLTAEAQAFHQEHVPRRSYPDETRMA